MPGEDKEISEAIAVDSQGAAPHLDPAKSVSAALPPGDSAGMTSGASDLKTEIDDLIVRMDPVTEKSEFPARPNEQQRGIRGKDKADRERPSNTASSELAARGLVYPSEPDMDSPSTGSSSGLEASPSISSLPPPPVPYSPPPLDDPTKLLGCGASRFRLTRDNLASSARPPTFTNETKEGHVVWIHKIPAKVSPDEVLALYPDLASQARILSFPSAPTAEKRFRPDVYYDWQTSSCQLVFLARTHAEKFLATFPYFPNIKDLGIAVPQLTSGSAPWPIPATAFAQPRRIRLRPSSADATSGIGQSQLVGLIYDLSRSYGPLKEVSVVYGDSRSAQDERGGAQSTLTVQYVHEGDAAKLEEAVSRGEWQRDERLTRLGIESCVLERSGSGPVAEQECVLSTLAEGQDHLLALPAFPAPPRPLSELAPAPLPSMPQQAITPWADHNVTAKLSVYSPTAETGPVLSGQTLKRHLDTGYPMHESTSRCGRWAVEVDRGPDGSIRDSRLVAKDGSGATYRHVSGSCVVPSPAHGPGSESKTGWIDLSIIHVHPVGPDINATFLAGVFSHYGPVRRAVVRRDKQGRPTGHAFISFTEVESAARAMEGMDGTSFGGTPLRVRFHEANPPALPVSRPRTTSSISAAVDHPLRL